VAAGRVKSQGLTAPVGAWSQVSGLDSASFETPNAAGTAVNFPAAGVYVLRLTASDTQLSASDEVTVIVNPAPMLDYATLTLAVEGTGPFVIGTPQTLHATLHDGGGNPLPDFGVSFAVSGPNATEGTAITDDSGVATFDYTGTNVGTDAVQATAEGNVVVSSNTGTLEWTTDPASGPPSSTQGWIGSPANESVVSGIVPISIGPDVTLIQGTVDYWPAADPATVTVLSTTAQGGPGTTVATLDTTLLPNGSYIIRLDAIDASGHRA
jgi:hypothetical protein